MGAVEREALVRAYIAARRQLGDGLAGLIDRWFDSARSFRDADAARFIAQVVPAATGAQQATAALTWAFQARMLAEVTGDPRPPAALETAAVTGSALRGVDMATVYRRPFVQIWRRLAEGADLAESVAAGRRRAQSIAATDLQLASTRTSREVMADPRSGRYYRRQLTGAENCGLCVLASTQRYNRGDLLPIHPDCDCVAVPLAPGEAVDRVLDPELLEAAHTAIEDRFGRSDRGGRAPNYRRVVLVREHGELGPLLTVKSHSFTSADDLPAVS